MGVCDRIVDTDKELTVTAELPGMDLKDIDLSVDDGILMIRSEKSEEKTEKDKNVHLYERSNGWFQRGFSLPPMVDVARISADFRKGVL